MMLIKWVFALWFFEKTEIYSRRRLFWQSMKEMRQMK